MALFVGRVSSSVRSKDIEDLFRKYGPLKRCEVKGTYAFVTFDDDRDAEDALKDLQGHDLYGSRLNIEWAKGSGRFDSRGGSSRSDRDDKRCFTCNERGHFARDCRRSRRSRSRSRSRRRRSRSRSRSKSRSRDRRSRSRSRERRRRSRSRSRSRGRDRSKDRRSRSRSRSKSRERSAERSTSRSRSRGRKRERSQSPARDDEPDSKRQKLSPSGGDGNNTVEPPAPAADETSHKED